MDETPMRFELPLSRTLEFSGSRTIPVKSCGAKKRSFTVTLAVAAGSKLPPAVIFKGVPTPRDLAVPDSVRVSFQKKGWMDEKGKLLVYFFLYFKVCDCLCDVCLELAKHPRIMLVVSSVENLQSILVD